MSTKRSRRKWPLEKKREIAETVQRRLRAGEKFSHISRELGILDGTLRLWIRQLTTAQMLPVEIQECTPPTPEIDESEISATIVLHTPSGLRFEGLDVGDVVVLLEHLR